MPYALTLTLEKVKAYKLTEKKDDELYLEVHANYRQYTANQADTKESTKRHPEEKYWQIQENQEMKLDKQIFGRASLADCKLLVCIHEQDKAGLMKLLPGKEDDFIGEFYIMTSEDGPSLNITLSGGDYVTEIGNTPDSEGRFQVRMNGGNSDYVFSFLLQSKQGTATQRPLPQG